MLELPSGLWADRFSRRRLLTLAPALTGIGFGLWTFLPSYPAFAAGFVLWGAGSALRSGTLQALVYEELARSGAADSYTRLIGRSQAAGIVAEIAAALLAVPALAAGGYRAAGVASVLACVAGVVVGRCFPGPGGVPAEVTAAESGPGPGPELGAASGAGTAGAAEETETHADDGTGFATLLRHGFAEVRASRSVRRAVLALSVLTGILAYDEYLSLFARSTGVADTTVPLLMLPVLLASAIGAWCADRGHRHTAPALALSAVCLALGALSDHPAGLALIAVAYGIGQWSLAAADARLQERITDRTRATVSSLAGFGSEVFAILIFAGFALGSVWSPPGPLIAAAALPYLAVSFAFWRRKK